MEVLFEILFELVFEGGIEASKSKKVPKIIRHLLIFFIVIFWAVIIVGLFVIGILALKENTILGIFMILISILFLVSAIVKFRKVYLKR